MRLTTLNTRGTPPLGTGRRERHAAIGHALEDSGAAICCFQEVDTRYQRRTLARSMPSFRFAALHESPAGPAGGLLVLSRVPVEVVSYQRLPAPSAGLPLPVRVMTWHAGALVVRAAGLHIINVHPTANRDGDWSPSSRYKTLHDAQLSALARLAADIAGPVVVCGDFNIARESQLFAGFLAATGLTDAFHGRCPPTFRAEYLPHGARPKCIDFILTGGPVRAERAAVMFADQPVSDHLGLRADLCTVG